MGKAKILVLACALTLACAPSYANLVTNGDFSDGLNAWTTFQAPWSETLVIDPSDGSLHLSAINGSFGVYQAITTVPGAAYTVNVDWMGNAGQYGFWDEVLFFNDDGRVVIDQIDTLPQNASVLAKVDESHNPPVSWPWKSPFDGSQWFWDGPHTNTIVATGTTMYVALKGGAYFGKTDVKFDNVSVTEAVPVTSIGQWKTMADGTGATIAGVIVTASTAEAGANYVEMSDRSSGIRAESETPFITSSTVTIQGTLATKPSGERYVANAFTPTQELILPVGPLTTKVSSLGPAASQGIGLHSFGTVGLFMTVAGNVLSTDTGFFMLSDGGESVKVDTTSVGSNPAQGSFVIVTGIVELSGETPETAETVLYPRSSSDIVQ